MKKLPTAVGCVLLLALASAPAAGQVLDGPEGPVEFLGLERWGAQELFDTIQERDPARPFSACAAVMRFELGFADAGAFSYRNVGSSEVYTVVVGVEDSARVRFRPAGSETVALPDAWVVLKAVAAEDPRALDAAARTLHLKGRLNRMLDRVGRFFGGMDAGYEGAKQVVDFVERADGDRDRRLALEVLARDSSMAARAVATLVLGNFLHDDVVWHSLVGSAIDPDARVGGTALAMLRPLANQDLGPVDWSGGRAALSSVFAGTNPFAFESVLRILVATHVDPEFGQGLVRDDPRLLLAYAGAEHDMTRDPAIEFLEAVSGEDFGTDVSAWTAWVRSLQD